MELIKIHKKTAAISSIIFIVLVAVPQLVSPFTVHSLINLLMYATLAIAWNWLGGYAGQVSVGHVMFFGLGAYGTGIMNGMFGFNPWVGTLFGILIAVVFGFLIGIPCFRLRGHYFVIATLALGEIMLSLFMGWTTVGGGSGYFIPFQKASIFNFQFGSKNGYYYVLLAFFVLGIAITVWLERSKVGYYLRAVKGDLEAARSIGIDTTRYKQIAMSMSAAMTALLGAFWANYILFIDPESVFPGSISFKILLITVVGGAGTVLGPIIGALIIIPLTEGTRMLFGGMGSGFDSILYGTLIMVMAVLQPEGIMGFVKSYKRKKHYKQKQDNQLVEGSENDAIIKG